MVVGRDMVAISSSLSSCHAAMMVLAESRVPVDKNDDAESAGETEMMGVSTTAG